MIPWHGGHPGRRSCDALPDVPRRMAHSGRRTWQARNSARPVFRPARTEVTSSIARLGCDSAIRRIAPRAAAGTISAGSGVSHQRPQELGFAVQEAGSGTLDAEGVSNVPRQAEVCGGEHLLRQVDHACVVGLGKSGYDDGDQGCQGSAWLAHGLHAKESPRPGRTAASRDRNDLARPIHRLESGAGHKASARRAGSTVDPARLPSWSRLRIGIAGSHGSGRGIPQARRDRLEGRQDRREGACQRVFRG